MESMEFNKIAGAVLGALLFAVGLNVLAEGIFSVEKPAKPGYLVQVAEAKSTEAAPAKDAPAAPIAERMKVAKVDAGEKVFGNCKTCHNAEDPAKGGKDGAGPNLWGVLGGPAAHRPAFAYSNGMQAKAKSGTVWGYAELDQFLANPAAYVEGTKMKFNGLAKPEDRAAVIMYLRSKASTELPLPN